MTSEDAVPFEMAGDADLLLPDDDDLLIGNGGQEDQGGSQAMLPEDDELLVLGSPGLNHAEAKQQSDEVKSEKNEIEKQATDVPQSDAAQEDGLKEGEEEEQGEERVGTPFYLAPELWTKPSKYSKKSDVWALGVILYELCCLGYPFPATQMEELEEKVLNDPIKPHPICVQKPFVEFFSKMLEKDADKRPCIESIIYSDIF